MTALTLPLAHEGAGGSLQVRNLATDLHVWLVARDPRGLSAVVERIDEAPVQPREAREQAREA